jgi:DNA modification methylase
MKYEIIKADVLEALKAMPDASFDAVLTDPPYALGTRQPTGEEIIAYLGGARLDTGGDFMAKQWDLPSVEVWRETMRVLKPGAHVLAFGGSRMFDLLTVGIRAAGFGVKDILTWLHSTGFPKSLNVSKAIDAAAGAEREVIGEKMTPDGKPYSARRPNSEGRYHDNPNVAMNGSSIHDSRLTAPATPDAARFEGYGTALKPAWEGIILARKPIDGTIAANALTHGTGALNIDGTRVGYASAADRDAMSEGVEAIRDRGGVMNNSWKNSSDLSGANPASPLGRWPANVVMTHGPECRQVGMKKVRCSHCEPGKNLHVRMGPTSFQMERGSGYGDAEGLEEVEAWECVPDSDCPVRLLDEQSGSRPGMSGGGVHREGYGGGMFGGIDSAATARNDDGGASRFFYTAKASRAEREFGCDGLPERTAVEAVERDPDSAGAKNPRAGAGRGAGAVRERCARCDIPVGGSNHAYLKIPCIDGGEHEAIVVSRGEAVRNHHVAVKPLALTRWLATLLLPPPLDRPRRVLVLYSGSGSEMIGALRAGWDEIVGIEREADYCEIARARLARWSEVPAKMSEAEAVGEARAETKKVARGQTTLF